jgi:hypothetical protein
LVFNLQVNELEESRANEMASVEADVTARLRLEMTSLEDQIQDKNRVSYVITLVNCVTALFLQIPVKAKLARLTLGFVGSLVSVFARI